MRQRLGIAQAIMEQPELLFLDEPTNSLDEEGVKLVRGAVYGEKYLRRAR
jgi:ABC-2 type transport system ATP-binding protein